MSRPVKNARNSADSTGIVRPTTRTTEHCKDRTAYPSVRHRSRPIPGDRNAVAVETINDNASQTSMTTAPILRHSLVRPVSDVKVLVAKAAKLERKLRRAIGRASTSRERNAAQRQHMKSLYTRVAAVVRAAQKQKRNLPAFEIVRLAKQLDMRSIHSVRPVRISKYAGGVRTTWAYDLNGRAVQEIARWQLSASASAPSWQYAAGGKSPVDLVEEVAADLENGAKWVLIADIRNCFPSFDAGRAAAALPIPRQLARSALAGERRGAEYSPRLSLPEGNVSLDSENPLLEAMREVTTESFTVSYSHECGLGLEPGPHPGTAICQGSAFAPMAVYVLLGDLDCLIPKGAKLRAWADNLVVTARTRREIEEAQEALTDALHRSPLGRLGLKFALIRRHDWGINLLGYRLRTWRGQLIVTHSRRNQLVAELHFWDAFRKDITAGDLSLPKVRLTLNSWTAYFRLSQNARSWAEKQINYAEFLVEVFINPAHRKLD